MLRTLEICWVICHGYMIYAAIALVSILNNIPETKTIVTHEWSFYVYWGFANGPLAWAVIV